MNTVVGEQRGRLDMSDGVSQLTSGMRVLMLHRLKVRDGRADESLQMSDVLMILMVMTNMRMSMVTHDDGVVAMLGMMSRYRMRHNSGLSELRDLQDRRSGFEV
jgi:hypothetical protein